MKKCALLISFCFMLVMPLVAQFQICNSSTTATLKDVFFFDENTGVAVGDAGVIIRSTDGGLNWQSVLLVDTVDFEKVRFFDNQNGLAIGSAIFNTTDGGMTWAKINHPNTRFIDLEILNETTCLLSGQPIGLMKSGDMGLSWDTLIGDSNFSQEIGLLSFVSEQVGYFCSHSGGLSTHTQKTIDGGQTWTLLQAPQAPNPTVMEDMIFVTIQVDLKTQ